MRTLKAQPRHSVALAYRLHYAQVGVCVENVVVQQGIVFEVICEVDEALVDK